MILPPGNFSDLDTLAEDAVRQGAPTLRLEEHGYIEPVPLLVAVCIHERLDLAELLFDAGATMTASNLSHIIWWNCSTATLKFLLGRGVPIDDDCLHNAIRHGNWDLVLALLDRGLSKSVKLPFKDIETTSLLRVAVLNDGLPLLLALLDREMDPDVLDLEGHTPLLRACDLRSVSCKTSPESIYWLLKYGADPNTTLPSGETALVLCLGQSFKKEDPQHYFFMRRTGIAQTLLRFGAKPNATAPNGATPLMFAARDNDVALARALLRFGARAETCTPKGETALSVATRWKSEAVRELLLSLR